jgi:putative restriction endonuclease
MLDIGAGPRRIDSATQTGHEVKKTAHEEALGWFKEHAGTSVSWPAPIRDIYLANKAKGIHKPAGLGYALSVRQTLTGGYDNLTRILSDGRWEISYAQEGNNPYLFTNKGLIACLNDDVPIGVLQQVRDGSSLNYQVLGLGRVVAFNAGQFVIRQLNLDNFDVYLALASRAKFVVQLDLDKRERIIRELNIRQGQPAFRAELLTAYGKRCAITGSGVVQTLEAAHIVPYSGLHTNHVQNGILMRSDTHILFDMGLLNINPKDFRVESGVFDNSEEYMNFHGQFLRLPAIKGDWPSRQALRLHLAKVPPHPD